MAGAVADSGPFLLNVPAGQMLWIPLKEDIKWQWSPLFFRSVLVGSVPLPAAASVSHSAAAVSLGYNCVTHSVFGDELRWVKENYSICRNLLITSILGAGKSTVMDWSFIFPKVPGVGINRDTDMD